jgi:hypothetical protein
MAKDKRLGSDPLDWIKDTREGEPESKQNIQSNTSIQSKLFKPIRQREPGNSVKKVTASKKGLPEGWIRGTFIIREDYLIKLKAKAYWDRKQIKTVLDEALASYFKGKKIRPIKGNK